MAKLKNWRAGMKRYEVEQIEGFWMVYDKQQDVYVGRDGYVNADGFLTKAEANAVVKSLVSK